MATDQAALVQSISHYLNAQGLYPTPQWLQSHMSTIRPSTPLQALQKTALFRLLASDITETITPPTSTTTHAILPRDINDPVTKETRLPRDPPVLVQILDMEDLGRSRWSQVELLEQRERGETTQGREMIRLAPDGEQGETRTTSARAPQVDSKGPHKLLLQDCRGNKVFGFELGAVAGLGLQTGIGAKLLIRDARVARGLIMLDAACVSVLGGKVEAWDKEWRAGRKDVLKTLARAGTAES